MNLNKTARLDCKPNQLQALRDQSKSSEPPLLPNYDGRANFIRSRNQPMTSSPTFTRSDQGRSSYVGPVAHATFTGYELEESSYDEIGLSR